MSRAEYVTGTAGDEKRIHNNSQKTWTKETTWVTQAYDITMDIKEIRCIQLAQYKARDGHLWAR
jgi:hypothetical protein